MKILFLIPYLHSDSIKPFRRFTTGLSYTLASIVSYFDRDGNDTYVFAQSAFTKEIKEHNTKYLRKSIFDIFPLSNYYLKEFVKDIRGQKLSAKMTLHILSYYLYGGYVERLLKRIKPDIVSIRGIGYITWPFILACEKTNTKYVVSLHGLPCRRIVQR